MKRILIVVASVAALAIPSAAMAAGGPTSGPVQGQPGNSCFGNWRAGTADGAVFAQRAQDGTITDHNAADFTACGFDGGNGLS
jgi:hypothetical protein